MNVLNWIYIEWCDAQTLTTGWKDVGEATLWANEENWTIAQVGVLLNETKEYLLIASKYNPQNETENQFAEITKIPKTWIRKRKKIAISS